ncbi:ribonuclease H [Trifolium pratense]|uniref:Ribonuclease H n=1 Tax=Trifolium pratense TaxID=57577 RepID=A0A2K3MX23_TRIPR|nr:ribonuclease H [Trifolium pratense]
MTKNDLCPRYQSQPETIMHMLRDCEDVQQYWNQFITEDCWAKFFSLGARNALLAELCGILFGCQMARDMRLTHVILEIDSTHVVNMINNRFTSIFYLQRLLHEVISLIHLLGWTIHVNHIHHEPNSCADALAFKGHDVGFTHVLLDSIPDYISTLLDKDLRGICSSIIVH